MRDEDIPFGDPTKPIPLPPRPYEIDQLTALTAIQTIALPEPPEGDLLLGTWVIRGERTVIGGATGHGKTTLTWAMLRAILTGDELLGVRGAGLGPVMYVDLEQGLRSIKRALREAELAGRDDVYIVRAPDGLALDDDDSGDLGEVERLIAEVAPVAVALDPYYKAHRTQANEERAITDLMRRLDGLRELHRFALLLPAHVRKAQESSGSARVLTLDDISGSGAVTRGAEVALGVERLAHGFARLRFLKDRDGELPVGEALYLTYSKVDGFLLKPEGEDVEVKALRDYADGEWRIAKEWAKALEVGETKAKELLGRLVEAGLAEYTETDHGRSSKAKCWRISDSAGSPSAVDAVTTSEAGFGATALTALGL